MLSFDVIGYVTGFGSSDWKRTHGPATRNAVVVSCLLKHGATCVGRTVMDELAFRSEFNSYYVTLIERKRSVKLTCFWLTLILKLFLVWIKE